MSSDDSETENEMDIDCTPPDLRSEAKLAMENLMPAKSKEKYMKVYENFMLWKNEKNAKLFSETVFLAYFIEIAETKKPPTLWAIYSMLKCTVHIKNSIDLKNYGNLSCPQQAVKEMLPDSLIKQENAEEPQTNLLVERVSNKKVIVKGWGDQKTDLNNLRKGVAEVMLNSNATPIRCHGNIGYCCCFCSDQYPDPADLKQHTLNKHQQQMRTLMAKTPTSSFVAKMDITDLECKHCNEPLNSIAILLQHLIVNHSITIYPAVKKVIIPFKFNSDSLQCCECSHIDCSFKMLVNHMSKHHYANHKCEVCESGFVTKAFLRYHKFSHERGMYKCPTCNKEFATDQQRKYHEEVVHDLENFDYLFN